MQNHRDATFGVSNTGTIGALAVELERAFRRCTWPEHRVVVDHQQKVLTASAFESAHDVVASGGGRRCRGDFSTQPLEPLN